MYVRFIVGVDGFIARQEMFYGANLTPPPPTFGKDVSETIVHSLMENLICQRHTYIMPVRGIDPHEPPSDAAARENLRLVFLLCSGSEGVKMVFIALPLMLFPYVLPAISFSCQSFSLFVFIHDRHVGDIPNSAGYGDVYSRLCKKDERYLFLRKQREKF